MKRDDWFWLAVKCLGLWLLHGAIWEVPGLAYLMISGVDESNTEQLLYVFVPLLAAVFLLADGARLLGRLERRRPGVTDASSGPEDVVRATEPRNLSREDLLWLAMKVSGLLIVAFAGWALVQMSPMLFETRLWTSSMIWVVVGFGVVLLIGAWLLFGSTLHRLAARR